MTKSTEEIKKRIAVLEKELAVPVDRVDDRSALDEALSLVKSLRVQRETDLEHIDTYLATVAALREALNDIAGSGASQWWLRKRANKALTDTDKIAAEFKRVPEGYEVVRMCQPKPEGEG